MIGYLVVFAVGLLLGLALPFEGGIDELDADVDELLAAKRAEWLQQKRASRQ